MTEDKNIENARECFAAFLRSRGKRQTDERFAILDRAMRQTHHFTIDEFYRLLEDEGYHVSMATVYSTFQLLCEAGLLRRHQFDNRSEYERLVVGSGHTHLICTHCGRVREVRDADLCDIVGSRHYRGFQTSHFAVYVYGLCSRCRRAERKSPK